MWCPNALLDTRTDSVTSERFGNDVWNWKNVNATTIETIQVADNSCNRSYRMKMYEQT